MAGFLRRLASWLRHGQVQADIADEIAFHREQTQRALERNGADRREALPESMRAMGNVTLAREDARGVWLPYYVESTWQDIRYALRTLARQPGFSLLAIGVLTAGIGLNTSVFTVYNGLAMKPWPVGQADRVVRVVNRSVFDMRTRTSRPAGSAATTSRSCKCRCSPDACSVRPTISRDHPSRSLSSATTMAAPVRR